MGLIVELLKPLRFKIRVSIDKHDISVHTLALLLRYIPETAICSFACFTAKMNVGSALVNRIIFLLPNDVSVFKVNKYYRNDFQWSGFCLISLSNLLISIS